MRMDGAHARMGGNMHGDNAGAGPNTGSRAAQKRARKLQKKQQAALKPAAGPSRPAPPPVPPTLDGSRVGNKREKRKAKRLAKRQQRETEHDGADEPEELEGVVVDGELLLRDGASGAVYSSERDERGRLVQVGRWEAGAVVPLELSGEERGAPAAAPATPPSVPHPVPQPLAFDAAEDDHCETAPDAYAHIAELLRRLASALGYTDPAELRIYDPYFCNGAVTRHLGALGFPNVHNVNEDFYAVVASGRVPTHDVVVTNPPYSGAHPSRLLDFLANNRRPWLALMPNWVHAKDYYAPATRAQSPFYVVPRKRYHYWTPRGRRADVASGGAKAKTHGHTNAALGVRTSPFVSFWYGAAFPPALRAQLPRPDGCVVCMRAEALPPGVLADSDPQRWGGGGGGGTPNGGGEQRKKKQRSQ